MIKWWREAVIGVLVLLLLAIIADYIVIRSRYDVLQERNERTEQTLIRSTQLVVELRQKLIPRDFGSMNELRQWVDDWEKNNKPVVLSILGRTFVITGSDELYSHYWDCDDISEAMQRDAHKDGYVMSVCLVDGNGAVLGVEVSDLGWHAGCMVTTENAFWFIEPQTGEIVMIIARD